VLARLQGARSVRDLQGYTFGQGHGWTDSRILGNAGLHVEEGDFGNLVHMLQGRRFDLVPLSSDEAHGVLDRQRAMAPDVDIDTEVGLLYPSPRVFYVTRGNAQLHAALTQGLKAAQADGSLSALLKHTSGIGPILTGQRALPPTLIGLSNPWLANSLRDLSLDHFHPPLRPMLRTLLPQRQGQGQG